VRKILSPWLTITLHPLSWVQIFTTGSVMADLWQVNCSTNMFLSSTKMFLSPSGQLAIWGLPPYAISRVLKNNWNTLKQCQPYTNQTLIAWQLTFLLICDDISEKVPYCGTNSVILDQLFHTFEIFRSTLLREWQIFWN